MIVPLEELVQESFTLTAGQLNQTVSGSLFNYSVCCASVHPALHRSRKGKYCRLSSRGQKCAIVLAGEQKPAENSAFECGVTVKRLNLPTPSVIDEHLLVVFYHCLFDIINLSG